MGGGEAEASVSRYKCVQIAKSAAFPVDKPLLGLT